jgi:hypothetical protein
MQTTIYYNEQDRYLLNKVDMKARKERKSRSAVILSILEEYFEHKNKLGEILLDMGELSLDNLEKGLHLQQRKFADKLLGEILLTEELVSADALDRALMVQRRFSQ